MTRIGKHAWILALFSGILQVLIFPSASFYVLSWLAVAPLMVALLVANGGTPARRGQSFLLGYLCGFVWYLGSCYWVFHVMNTYGQLAIPVAAGVLVLFCLYLGLYHALFAMVFAAVARRLGGGRALALAPVMWVAVELARARITGFPWDLLGTAQVDNIPLTRIATVTGVYGVSFMIMVVNAAFALAMLLAWERRRTMLVAAAAAAITLQSGVMLAPPASPTTHTARLIQQNIPILDSSEWTAEFFDHTIAELVQMSRPGQSGNPSLIIWPESPAPFFASDPKFHHWLTALAEDAQAPVIAGSLGTRNTPDRKRPSELLNSAAVFTPGGLATARYDKIHLVPWGEYVPFQSLFVFAEKLTREVGDFGRGTERTVFKLPTAPDAGVFICYESIFPDEVRLFARNGAQVFVNISNDGWFGDTGAPGQHLNMARMRAIENNRWVLRSTNTGISGSIDPLGRVVATAPRKVRAAVDVPFAAVNATTLYTRYGDWFAYACAIIALIALALPRHSSVR